MGNTILRTKNKNTYKNEYEAILSSLCNNAENSEQINSILLESDKPTAKNKKISANSFQNYGTKKTRDEKIVYSMTDKERQKANKKECQKILSTSFQTKNTQKPLFNLKMTNNQQKNAVSFFNKRQTAVITDSRHEIFLHQ